MKRILLYIFIFALVGEVLIRFDKTFNIMEEGRVVKISTDIEITPEYDLLKRDFFKKDSNSLKIMVLGDSYIHGGGIDFQNNFSQNLKRYINDNKRKFNKGWVLDVSKPDSNNLDNNETYFEFVDKFKPNIVILGYNINDIRGNLEKTNQNAKIDFKDKRPAGENDKSLKGKIYKVLKSSEFIYFVVHKAHNLLKANGIILPGSKFSDTIDNYSQNKDEWNKSKKLLEEIIEDTQRRGIQLIVYKFPEINLIEYPELFAKIDNAIGSFFSNYDEIYYLDGSKHFINESSDQYILSKYDGHPNEKAHKKMANKVYDLIKSTHSSYNNDIDEH